MRSFRFEELSNCPLLVGAVYEGGTVGTIADEPIDKLLHCGNMGGFRILGSAQPGRCRLVVLFTTFEDHDWPDRLESSAGRFVYYGDNKKPGSGLHETSKGGNELLRWCFEWLHVPGRTRADIPPFFVFSKTGRGRSVRFHGLAVPGASDLGEAEDLVAIWKTKDGSRFQNYRAVFTILGAELIDRAWIDSLVAGTPDCALAPSSWKEWLERGLRKPLIPPEE